MLAEVDSHAVQVVVHDLRVHAVLELRAVLLLDLLDVWHVACFVGRDPVSVDSVLHLALIIKLFKLLLDNE